MCYNKKIKKQTGSDHSYFIGKRHIMYMKKTDQGEQKRALYIQTLGTMRLTSGDEIISLHTSITGKACQLFLLLAYAGTKGITRTALQDALYDRKTTDAANALRINASRLRKLLMQESPFFKQGNQLFYRPFRKRKIHCDRRYAAGTVCQYRRPGILQQSRS